MGGKNTIKNWDGLLIINHSNEIDKYEYTTDRPTIYNNPWIYNIMHLVKHIYIYIIHMVHFYSIYMSFIDIK